MDYKLNGKTAVVVGGARGIGFATARMLAGEGAAVAIVDINAAAAAASAKQMVANGTKAQGFGADIAKLNQVQRVHDEIVKGLAAPDILINCAAVVDEKLFLESGPDDWERILSVCLYGTIHCLRTFVPGMTERKYGRVVCLASNSARIGQARLSYYAAAKGGVIALAKSLAQEVSRNGVTINIVSPGTTNTELRQAREARLLEEMGPERYERRNKAVLKLYPCGRIGQPDDIAAMNTFLASDHASWITGQVVSVNGGFSMV